MRTLMLSLIVVGLLASTAPAKIWTAANGAKVDAEYVGAKNGMVKLKFNRTGKVAEIPLGTLSEEDQKYVQTQINLEEEKEAAKDGPPDRFTQAIKQDPLNPSNYINRGRARTAKEEYDSAIMDFTKAIKMNAENGVHDPDAYNGRGKAYHKKNDLISAQRDFNQAIQVDGKYAPAYRNRGENLYKLALDKKQSVPELDQAIERWQQFMNSARQSNMKRAPWQPLNATKGDVSRPAVLRQMAKIDFEWADWLDRDRGDWGHDGHHGHGGHGHGCNCEACSGDACNYCEGRGCGACGGGKPAPGLGVYPPECMKGETITLVANANQLVKGMPAEAKAGEKPGPNAPKIDLDSVDFYRDVNGDGLFNATDDQYLASDCECGDGFTTEVSTAAFPPGPQSFFAVPRGAEGSGSGASPAELLSAAEACEKAAQTEEGIAQACETGKAQGMSEDQSKGLGGDQSGIKENAAELAEKIAGACPEAAELLEEADKPMKAVGNLMKTAATKPGEACKEHAEKANDKASEAAEKLAKAAEKLREAYEAAKAAGAGNPGQAPASAATGSPTSGAGEILAAAPIGTRGPGGDGGDGGDDCDDEDDEWFEEIVETEIYDDEEVEEIVDIAEEYIEVDDYENAVVAYDELLERDPDNLVYLRDRANTHMLRGGYDYAVRDYDYLLKQREEPDADLYYNRGCAHLAAGRLDLALSDFDKSISLNETYSLAYNNRGATYARKGDFETAIVDFNKAIEIEPDNRLAFRNRALAFKKLGNLRRAQEDFDVVLRLEKQNSSTGTED